MKCKNIHEILEGLMQRERDHVCAYCKEKIRHDRH